MEVTDTTGALPGMAHAAEIALACRLTGRPLEPPHGDALTELLAETGEAALARRDWMTAHQLVSLAVDLGHCDDSLVCRHLYLLGIAAEGLGAMEAARSLLREAAVVAERIGDRPMMVRAAVRCVLPSDWRSNDPELAELLQRAAGSELDHADQVSIQAARAIIEMRTATADHAGQQLGWSTRPDVGQPMAEDALAASSDCDDSTRLLALLAWRSTHRGPKWLERRRTASAEAVALAERLDDARSLVDAGVWFAVDELEAGDRAAYDRLVSRVREAAERDGGVRLRWRAGTVDAGTAFLNGDVVAAERLRCDAKAIGQPVDLPGWLGADLLLRVEAGILTNDKARLEPFVVDHSLDDVDNAVGRAGVAYMYARLGRVDAAATHLWRGLRLADDEASILLFGTRAAAAALAIGRSDLVDAAARVLEPWPERISIDTNAWWCDGPVALWSAALRRRLGDHEGALRLLEIGEPLAEQIGHPAARRRAALLRLQLTGTRS